VYYPRIQREGDAYIVKNLGAFGADLSAVAHFFDRHWDRPKASLTIHLKASVLNWAAFGLRALGRLAEAVQPMQASLDMRIKEKDWKNAASAASSLSELQLTRGAVEQAVKAAEQSVSFADQSGDAFSRMAFRTTLADSQHQAADWLSADTRFVEAKKLQREMKEDTSQLYSLQGFRYCDLLLTAGEWRDTLQRARQTLEQNQDWYSLLSIALDKLSIGRASLQQSIAEKNQNAEIVKLADLVGWISNAPSTDTQAENPANNPNLAPDNALYKTNTDQQSALTQVASSALGGDAVGMSSRLVDGGVALSTLQEAVDGLRQAGAEEFVARGLLARASCYRFLLSCQPNISPDDHSRENHINLALADLEETHNIAERGGMRLFLTDYHLEASRLALTLQQPIFDLSAKAHLDKARVLIEETGYKRRWVDVAYLEAVLLEMA
jgi:hypothetical protein